MEEKNRGYKLKTINSIITKKFNKFTASIKVDAVRKMVEENTIITGGCIASMLQGQEVNDYDLYFTNKETVLAVAKYYVSIFNVTNKGGKMARVVDGADYVDQSAFGGVGLNLTKDRVKIIIRSAGVAGEEPDEDDYVEPVKEIKKPEVPEDYRPVYLTCNAISLSDDIQMVIRFYGDAKTIHDNYDFIHCTNYWDSKSKQVTVNQGALLAIMAKELIYVGSKYPIASMIRTRKFINRGWVVNAGQFLKIAYQISKLHLDDIEVLEDQLVGVDVAYFNMLIAAMQQTMKERLEKGEPAAIDYNYLANIIDKLF